MNWKDIIISAHTAVTNEVSHNTHLKSERYFVWGEIETNDLVSGNIHSEKAVRGYTDLYTKKEFDEWKEELENSFEKYGISWQLNSVQYEEETGFTHYEWYWEVVLNG